MAYGNLFGMPWAGQDVFGAPPVPVSTPPPIGTPPGAPGWVPPYTPVIWKPSVPQATATPFPSGPQPSPVPMPWATQAPSAGRVSAYSYTPGAHQDATIVPPSSVLGAQPGQIPVQDNMGRIFFVNAPQGGTLPWGAFQSQMAPAEVGNIWNRQMLGGQGQPAQETGPVTHPTTSAAAQAEPQYQPAPAGLIAQAAEQGFNVPENWWQEFQAEHEGETPLEYYGAQGYGDQSLGAALHDLDWSQGVMAQTGAPPTDAQWVQHWYHKQGMMTHDEYEKYKKKLEKDRKKAKEEATPQRPPTWQPPLVWWDT